MNPIRTCAAGVLAATALTLGAASAAHADPPSAPAPFTAAQTAQARAAADAPASLATLSRFFDRDGKHPAAASEPHLAGPTVTVFTLDPGFVAGRAGAPVADPDFLASKAVSADGQVASLWTVRTASGWKVVNIATGGDEVDYVTKAHGAGTVFREPQIDAWYVLRAGRVLPLDAEARHAVGAGGATLADYQRLVHREYGDKLPGSAYDREGKAGGYGGRAAPTAAVRERAAATGTSAATAGTAAAAGALLAGAAALAVRRLRRSRRTV
ncbi:hypothetical protein [Streptomyces silvisoli]|uniref:Gram-positive cocci surface proteins LPxTG domain-containing protein n=1 Tax=Streptomyces silvisoli TaxID=3034235 RepID=A0ABT5ZUI3_9ACTN|nr:hypothetical protein [Streptomyces silvisoli]MDF3293487.1 hypothetical protein [Streptomyces silvisoli]